MSAFQVESPGSGKPSAKVTFGHGHLPVSSLRSGHGANRIGVYDDDTETRTAPKPGQGQAVAVARAAFMAADRQHNWFARHKLLPVGGLSRNRFQKRDYAFMLLILPADVGDPG